MAGANASANLYWLLQTCLASGIDGYRYLTALLVQLAYHHHELADERRRALQYLADQIHHLAEVHRRQLPSSEISVASTQREPANC